MVVDLMAHIVAGLNMVVDFEDMGWLKWYIDLMLVVSHNLKYLQQLQLKK
jgi:hypothetical protein